MPVSMPTPDYLRMLKFNAPPQDTLVLGEETVYGGDTFACPDDMAERLLSESQYNVTEVPSEED